MKKYDDEFKEFKPSAVKKVFDGQSVASVARDLGYCWRIHFKPVKSRKFSNENGRF